MKTKQKLKELGEGCLSDEIKENFNGWKIIAYNGLVLCEGGDFKAQMFNLPTQFNSSTNV